MPYSEKSKYKHHRQRPPDQFEKSTFKTVPVSHSNYTGTKFKVKGAEAIVGRLKKQFRPKTKKNNKVWAVQSFLIPYNS